VLSYHGSDIADKTRRQLIACELNLLSETYAMGNTAAHAGLCKAAEDALAMGDTEALHQLHDLLDQVNNLGHESDCETIAVGDTIIYTITVTADLPEAQTAQVRDRLDSALEVVHISDGGQYFADGHFVQWQLDLPAGESETQLTLWVKVNALPQGDNLDAPGADWVCSDWVELDVTNCQGSGGDDDDDDDDCDDGDDDDDDDDGGCTWKRSKRSNCKTNLLQFLKRKMRNPRRGRKTWFRNRRDDDCRGLTDPHADRSTDDLCCHCPGDDDDDDDDDDDCETRVLKNRACIRTTPPPPPPPGDDDDDDDDDDGAGCTYTIGYWKTHPEDWPVDEIVIGTKTLSAKKAMAILWTPPKGDPRIILAHQLIAAKLNIANGADPTDVADTIAQADAWLADHEGVRCIRGPSRDWGIQLAETLDDYNNGLLGPGHCDDLSEMDLADGDDDDDDDDGKRKRVRPRKLRGAARGFLKKLRRRR
jgi:hypothetical protein